MTGIRRFAAVAVTAGVFLAAGAPAKDFAVDPASVLETLDQSHPRLMLKDRDLQALKALHGRDKTLQKCVRDTIRRADSYLNKAELTYHKIGPRLLHVSRECVSRVYALGLAYRWTGQEKYARKVVENLLAVCAFDDWNPSHFLDTAEMSHAVGVGYDWLYSYMDAGTRGKISSALIKNGMEPGLVAYRKSWWPKSAHNWNQVCNSGLIIGALAIAESDPQYARQIITAAVASLPRAIQTYGPDGAWGEGPGYWHYASRYTAYGLTALQTALGTDFGLLGIEGLSQAGYFPIYTTGPTGLLLNFADCGERASRRTLPCLFWFARTFDNPFYAEAEHQMLARHTASPAHVVWYVPAPRGRRFSRDLDRYFRGPVEVVLMRSSWQDPDALFVGVKAGYNQVNHGHLDLGNFELDALGVRWARDLGSDNYNLPGYWDSKSRGRRWSYYRLNSKSHSVPLLGGEDQDPYAKSSVIKFEAGASAPFAVIDLSSAYRKYSKRTARGVAMVQGRRAVLVQDEFEIEKPCELIWAMTTDAEITPKKGGLALLALKGKKLTARILSPAGVEFTVESAEQAPPQKKNAGVRRLIARIPKAAGSVRLAVLLSPHWADGRKVDQVQLESLSRW